MNRILVLGLVMLALFCSPTKKHPTQQDYVTALLASYYNVDDICIREYGSISPLIQHYAQNLFAYYPTECENIIIGNSTMDIGRQVSGFYDPSKTNNYGIGGNTACDMLLQMDVIQCKPKNVLIASADGNGILRGVSSDISIKTVGKIITKAKVKWNANVILAGVHPIQVTEANKKKNAVNEGVKNLPDCFIDMVSLFGVGIDDAPPKEFMADSIHYKEPIYTRLHNQIKNQCGVEL